MIRESEYFSFAGRKSTDFGIRNVGVSDGLFSENVGSAKTIQEVMIDGNDIPYHMGVTKAPKQFPVRFWFEEQWNDELIDEVLRWLNVDYYEPLFFSANIDRVFYAMPVDDISLIHNGLKEGYLELNMRCDSPYVYSHEQTTPWYNLTSSAPPTKDKVIEIHNKGHFTIQPQIWINKDGDGDVSIINLMDGNGVLEFKDLVDGETVYVDCENHIVETDLENTYRHDNFSDHYISFVYGMNTLKVTGDARIKFSYRFLYS